MKVEDHGNHDPHEVNGWCVGDLAVHLHTSEFEYWQVTHVPTLTSFMKAVPVNKPHSNGAAKNALLSWCQRCSTSE